MKGNKTFLEWVSTFGFREWILFSGIANVFLSFVLTYIIVLFDASIEGLAVIHGVLGLILLMIAMETH